MTVDPEILAMLSPPELAICLGNGWDLPQHLAARAAVEPVIVHDACVRQLSNDAFERRLLSRCTDLQARGRLRRRHAEARRRFAVKRVRVFCIDASLRKVRAA